MAIITIEPSDPRPIYQQIMDEIRRALVVGSLRADEPLPSVRRLAADLRVNPNTVQQAYRELERDGVVYVRRGMGTFVAGLSSVAEERRTLAKSLAERTLREAYRHGLDIDDLIAALRQTAASDSSEESS